jgi:tetratricopeptide (TPR) repeat protein
VSEPERIYIEDHFYTATGDLEKNKEVLELGIKAYPNNYSAYGNLSLLYNLYYGQYEKAVGPGNECARLAPGAPFGYFHAALAYMALNRLDETRALLQKAADAKADNLFMHGLAYEVAYLSGDSDAMQRQFKWAEGKPSEFYMLNIAAVVAASHGQMKKMEDLASRSTQISDRYDFKDATAGTLAGTALVEAAMGNAAKAREMAASSAALAKARTNLAGVAVALAMTGDLAHAEAITRDLGQRFPSDTMLHQVTIPEVQALGALNRKAPEQAITALQAAAPYEYGVVAGMYPVYIRGQAYLQAKKGAEAAAEFQKIVDRPGIVPEDPIHSLAKLQLGRAYAMAGDTAKARAAYQDFLALWKDADEDLPLLKEAKAEYGKVSGN